MAKKMPEYIGYYYDPDINLYIQNLSGKAATPRWMETNGELK